MKEHLAVLGELCRIQSGGTPSRTVPCFYGGGIPWAKISDLESGDGVVMTTEETISSKGLAAIRGRSFPAGSILLAMYGSVGKVAVAGTELATNQAILGIQILDPQKLDAGYLRWWLRSMQKDLIHSARGVTQQNISAGLVRNLRIPLPVFTEQRRIAAILDKADALKQKRRRALELLQGLSGSIFTEMFGDLEKNARQWPAVDLTEVCKRITDGTHQPPKWSETGVPFIFVSNVRDGVISFETEKFISQDTWRGLMQRCPVEVGDILYTTVGSYGNAALVETDRPFAFQRHIAHIKPDREKIMPEFLASMLQAPTVRYQVDRQVRGVAQKTLNLRELSRIKVLHPPFRDQQQFVKAARFITAIQRKLEIAVKESGDIFSLLGRQAFRGGL